MGDLDDVASGSRHRREQLGEGAGPVIDPGEEAQPSAGPRLGAVDDPGEDAGVDVAAREDGDGGANRSWRDRAAQER